MKVTFVGAGPGDPELLTVKAQRLLREARCCIWAGSLVNPAILELVPPTCEVYDSAGMTLEDIISLCVSCRDRDIDVIRLHTGEPSLYGAILEQMARLDAVRIPYEVVPGISAFQAAAAELCVELTVPDVSQAVVITRGQGRTPLPQGQELAAFARTQATLCLYLSTHLAEDVVATLMPYYGADCPAAFCHKVSWSDARLERCTLGTLGAAIGNAGRTGLILVGRALARQGAESCLYRADFSHGFREADPS